MRYALLVVAVLTVGVVLLAPDAQAACGTLYLISTNSTVVSNPSWCGGYGCYAYQGGPPVSDDVEAVFWALGTGDPAIGQGNDSGSLAQDQWLFPFNPDGTFGNGVYYYGVTFSTHWATAGIDGCVTGAGPPGNNCTVILISDQHDGAGYFALLSQRSDSLGHVSFTQSNGAPFLLAPIPRPTVVAVTRIPPLEVAITVTPPAIPDEALYLDTNGCDIGAVAGYKIYLQEKTPGSPQPVDRRRDNWQVAPGGEWPGGQPLPLDVPANIQFECGSAPFYLATSLVFDSGFELAHVSEQTGEILCDPFCVDLDSDGWCVFSEVPELPWDCDDGNSDIHPYAAEINDGVDNQCPGFAGFGTIDEISGRTGFFNAADSNELSWPAQSGATLYEIARSGEADFSGACAIDATSANVLDIFEVPDPGEVLYLVCRAAVPLLGSWGQSSAGGERVLNCP